MGGRNLSQTKREEEISSCAIAREILTKRGLSKPKPKTVSLPQDLSLAPKAGGPQWRYVGEGQNSP